MPNVFVDTNILVYAADTAASQSRKVRIARELLLQRNLCISIQVLNEFTVNARHPRKLNLNRHEEQEWLSQWMRLKVLPLTIDSYLEALRIHLRFKLSHCDSLILAAAVQAGCKTLYSEDLNPGQKIHGVHIINPFESEVDEGHPS